MKKIIALAAIAAACSTSAFAQSGVTETGLNYNEVGVVYQTFKIVDTQDDNGNDTGSLTLKGYGVNGSYMLDKNFYVLGSTGTQSKTVDSDKVSANISQAGVGYRLGLAKNVDGFASVSYVSLTFKDPEGKEKSTGHNLTAGVRALVMPGLDVTAGVASMKIGDSSSNGYVLGLGYELTPSLVARINYSSMSDVVFTTVGLGYKF
jgi:opacity protein-like surface antigen